MGLSAVTRRLCVRGWWGLDHYHHVDRCRWFLILLSSSASTILVSRCSGKKPIFEGSVHCLIASGNARGNLKPSLQTSLISDSPLATRLSAAPRGLASLPGLYFGIVGSQPTGAFATTW
ncbi:hypothetical protein DENSPDRAFT_713981 [Dentipellis sp. KUC8613]|nr:hypothetical protein DENSPDRAFT_713981 [Dentipellis sp. KUC8613]